MPGFEAALSYSAQVLPKHSHLHSCAMRLRPRDSEAVSAELPGYTQEQLLSSNLYDVPKYVSV
jgi:hypothetical protein